jgi:hypothetical protein
MKKHIDYKPITIQDLKSLKVGKVFHDDVILPYKTTIDKTHSI